MPLLAPGRSPHFGLKHDATLLRTSVTQHLAYCPTRSLVQHASLRRPPVHCGSRPEPGRKRRQAGKGQLSFKGVGNVLFQYSHSCYDFTRIEKHVTWQDSCFVTT